MSSTFSDVVVSSRGMRSWLALASSLTVLFCSCQTVGIPESVLSPFATPVPDTTENPLTFEGSSGGAETEVTHRPATQPAPIVDSHQMRRRQPAPRQRQDGGATIVTPQEAQTQSAYPVKQVGYTEPVAAPRPAAAQVIPAQPLLPQPAGQPAYLVPTNVPVRQISSAGAAGVGFGAGPLAGHSCPSCQARGTHPPAMPTTPYGGQADHWGKPWQYGPWPSDEYICNGGDNDLSVQVADDWSVVGLHEGDTIAHYDTLEGEVVVEPTNEVCMYAPRFASVRRVAGVILHEQHLRSAGLELPTHLAQSGEATSATTVQLPLQPNRNLAITSLNRFRDKMRPGGLENLQAAAGTRGGFLPFEDFLIIRSGQFENSEKARLAERLQAAYTWSHDAALQVVVDNIDALEASSETGMQSVYTYEMPAGKPRLRVVKVASKQNALPGETVDFTIRFDNVGDRVIGNVTVIDNLNTRLEYVPDSQECTLQANFSASENEHESEVLRWEIIDPMKVGSGGVIRFQCRVR